MLPGPGACTTALVTLLAAAIVPAQTPPAEQGNAAVSQDELALIVGKWLDSDQVDEAVLGKAVAAVMAQEDAGLAWLGERLRAAGPPSEVRTKGLQSLATHVCLEFLRQQTTCGMVYAGQYDPLGKLSPFAGQLFLKMLLDTPDWYPSTQRKHALPVLRDLFPKSLGQDELLAMEDIAADVDFEPEDLRRAVSHGLHQWGRPRLAQQELEKWRRLSTEGDTEDRVFALRQLMDTYYQLRDYRAAGAVHGSMTVMAQAAKIELWPADHYTAACCHALDGDRERAFQALERAVEAHAAETTDPSLKLERKLFEQDPEIRSLRGTERFDKAIGRAFPAGRVKGEGKD